MRTFIRTLYTGKWLNHCIGGRNYVAFLMCVLSAVIAVLVILAACIAEITIYYLKPEWLNIWSGGNISDDSKNDTLSYIGGGDGGGTGGNNETIINEVIEQANATLISNLTNVLIANGNGTSGVNETSSSDDNLGLSINGTIFVIFAATVGLLAAISAGLLLHLCFFHVYISYLGLTTYEYIRQQRTTNVTTYPPPPLYQTQKNGTSHKKENGMSSVQTGQLQKNGDKRYTSFFRSKSAEADFYFCSSVNPSVEAPIIETVDIESQNRPKTLYCCDRVESHHHRHKAYYMCSVMEENTAENSMRDLSRINYYPPDDEARYESKTFHCCSEFIESSADNQGFNPDLGENPIGTVTGMIEQSRREAFLHYTEQCTFCSFRIKTPTKRQTISLEDKRCCYKSVAKNHHRWRRKWNCCSNVPDSPDVPMGQQQSITVPQQVLPSTVLNVRSLNQQQHSQQNPPIQQSTNDQRNNNFEINSNTNTTINYEENSANNNNISIINGNNNTTDTFLMNRHSPNNNTNSSMATVATTTTNNESDDIQQILTISSSLSNVSSSSTTTIMPPSSSSSNNVTPSKKIRMRGIRPVIRLRHMFRVLGKRYRRPRCRHGGVTSVQIKQNQIRPLSNTEENATGNNGLQQSESNNGQYSTITHQTILPTSAIRSETIVASYHHQHHQYTLPALPPPQRRKIRTTEDIQDLADTLTLVQQQTTPSTIIRLSTPNVSSNSIFNGVTGAHRRHSRRKQILRPRSPTLSPIHESGLSNPTSPLPCHRQNSGETPEDDDDDEEDDDITTSSISSLTNAHLCAKLNISPSVSPSKRQLKV